MPHPRRRSEASTVNQSMPTVPRRSLRHAVKAGTSQTPTFVRLDMMHGSPFRFGTITDLHRVCFLHRSEEASLVEARLLIEDGAEVDAKDNSGRTPLYRACHNRRYKLAKFLIDNGANVLPKDSTGGTLLHKACSNGRLDTVVFLAENGADIYAHDDGGMPPLYYALSHPDIVYFLVRRCPWLVMDHIFPKHGDKRLAGVVKRPAKRSRKH